MLPICAAAYGSSGPATSSILSDVFHVEMIKPARRSVAAELTDIHRAVDAGGLEQPAELALLLLSERLFLAIGAQAVHLAAHIEMRLVDRIAERLAGVLQDHEVAGLRHEGRQMPDRSLDHDIDALHR